MNKNYLVRKATYKDIPDLVRLRRSMFQSMNFTDQSVLDECDVANERYFTNAIPNGIHHAWVAENKSGIIGCGGLVIDVHPPGPTNLTGQIGYIMNMSVNPEYRRQGIAKDIFKAILIHLEENKIATASLHPTEMGRSLYEKFGFTNANEMRLKLSNIDLSKIESK